MAAVIWTPTERQAEFLAASEDEVLYGGSAGGGKALALDTPIPKPSGWTTMGEIQVGDVVFDEQGHQATVTYCSPVMIGRPCYRVKFSGGDEIVADGEHRWLTSTSLERMRQLRNTDEWRARRRASRAKRGTGKRPDLALRNSTTMHGQSLISGVRTTVEIANTLRDGPLRLNHSVDVPGSLETLEADIPIEPYILGAWLGDGNSASARITIAEPEMLALVSAAAAHSGYAITTSPGDPISFGITGGLTTALRKAELLGNKLIPSAYLRASIAQRIALLQGIMDTDGYADARGQCELTSTSFKLASGTLELVRSLGCKANISVGEATLYGRVIGPKYRIKFLAPFPAFRLTRKLERQKVEGYRGTSLRHYIEAVEPIASVPVRCIAVDSPSHLYLAGRSMIPTHNTDALVIDALGGQCRAVEQPEYRALLLRRTYPELKEVVDRTQAIYPRVYPGARYVEPEWRFPSGARLEMGYLDRDTDVMRYQSRQFQWIGWEELAQWESPYPYTYMLSRLRRPDRLAIPVYVRATCNPDGPGARWIADRWGIQPSGQSCRRMAEVEGRTFTLRFIAARLDDNPHLRDTGYREQLMRLPDEIRHALLDGRWDEPVIGGAIYADAIAQARRDDRITAVPHDPTARVDTWWDLGVADNTSIWFTQDVGREVHVIDFYEASGEGLPHYAGVLDKRGYLYGKHTAPHDIQVRELGSGRSRVETAASLGIRFETAPSIGLEEGIHATRMLFPRMWFDAAKCKPGLEALAHYRREYNKRMGEYQARPVHDWSSHAADAARTLGVAHKVTLSRPPPQRVRTLQIGGDASLGWLGA